MALERPKSLTELVTKEVRDWIIDGRLDLGAPLSEAWIARELAVSRTPVREAINRLEIEGLLKSEPQRGTFVFELRGHELAKLCEVRVKLETAALEWAMAEKRESLAEALAVRMATMTSAREQGDDAAYLREDTRFHQTIVDEADNRFLADAYQTIAAKTAALRNRLGGHPDHMAKSYAEHIAISAAVAAGDRREAERVLILHIGRKEGSYWTLLADGAEGARRGTARIPLAST